MVESAAALVAASLAVRLAPASRALRRSLWRSQGDRSAPAGEIAIIRRCLEGWSRRMPWRTKCLEQGLASHWMLSRRGFASTLHYGAATIDGELKAHVWVKSGEEPVVGCENSSDYALLATFRNA